MFKVQVLFKNILFQPEFQKKKPRILGLIFSISIPVQYYIHKENKNVELWTSKQNLYVKKELHEL